MNNNQIKEEVFRLDKEGEYASFFTTDIPDKFDIGSRKYEIEIIREPSFFSENNSWDAYSSIVLSIHRDKTPEELEIDRLDNEKIKQDGIKRRREQYEKLKKEFEVDI